MFGRSGHGYFGGVFVAELMCIFCLYIWNFDLRNDVKLKTYLGKNNVTGAELFLGIKIIRNLVFCFL